MPVTKYADYLGGAENGDEAVEKREDETIGIYFEIPLRTLRHRLTPKKSQNKTQKQRCNEAEVKTVLTV